MCNKYPLALIALLGMNGAALAETCGLPTLADSADLQPVPGSDLMTVPVAINGTPKQFLLDVGTDTTQVSQAAVTQLGLPEDVKRTETISGERGLTNGSLGSVSVYDVRDKTGSGGAQTRVRIAAFTIGGATGKTLQFLVANDAQMGKSPSEPYDGLLTGDFFKQYDVEMDFSGRELNYLAPIKCTDPNQVAYWPHSAVAVIPMTMVDGKITVPISVQGHEISAVIDTSSPRTVMRRDIAEMIMGLKAGTPDMMPVDGLTDGKGQAVYGHTFSQISFPGGVTANNVPALILTNSLTHEINNGVVLGSWARSADARIPDLTLGMDVLHQLRLLAAFRQNKLYVTAANLN